MEMTNYQLIQFIESLELSYWQMLGLTSLGLLALGICLREFLSWYLKVNDLKADIRDLKDQIKDLKALQNSKASDVSELESLTYPAEDQESSEPSFSLKESKKEASTSFPIDH